MDNWTTANLEDCLDALLDYRGKSPKKAPTGIPVLSAKVVKTDGLLRPIEQTIAPDYYDKWMVRGLPAVGDVVMTTEAPLGEVIQLDDESVRYALGQRIVCMRGKEGVLDSTFLRYALVSPQQQANLAASATGTTVLGISQKALRRIEISFPEIVEQRKIGGLLAQIDDKIELNRRMNETLEEMARALFRDWFVDFGPTRRQMEGATDPAAIMGQAFPPEKAAELAPLFPARLGEAGLPEGWSLGLIGDLCARIFSGGTPKTTEARYWGGELPWLSSGETRDSFLLSTEKTITQAGVDNSSTREANEGSTVIASAGQGKTRGQTSYLAFNSYINQSVVALEANPNVLPASVLYLDLERRYEEFRSVSDAHSSRGSLTTKLLAGLPTVSAPKDVFAALGGVVGPLFEKIIANKKESQTLAELRDLLLPKLMSGEIRLKDAEATL